MHNNYHFIKQLADKIATEWQGLQLMACFSQNKDELVLGFADAKQEKWIRALLAGSTAILSFPEQYARAKQNSADLFEEAIGLPITGAVCYENERAFSLRLTDGFELVFKLFGNKANILMAHQDVVTDVFHQKFSADYQVRPSALHRPILQTPEELEIKGLAAVFPTLGKEGKALMAAQMDRLPPGPLQQWQAVTETIRIMEDGTFYICRQNAIPELLPQPQGEVIGTTSDPMEALNLLFREMAHILFFEREKQQIISLLKGKIERGQAYIDKTYEKLHELKSERSYEEWANILMANLHQLSPRSKEVTLHDFYHDRPIIIRLNENLSPQKNAEQYYRKAKNQKIEVETLMANLEKKETEVQTALQHLKAIEPLQQAKPLRQYAKTHRLQTESGQQAVFPFRRFEFEGYVILVGKNAANNDLLTLKYASKEDIWLHARDVTGSHVVIKNQPGKKVPARVLEKAAALAAYYSARRTDSLCPVIYTPKKFVRKPKGLDPGAVVVEKESVLMIEPAPF